MREGGKDEKKKGLEHGTVLFFLGMDHFQIKWFILFPKKIMNSDKLNSGTTPLVYIPNKISSQISYLTLPYHTIPCLTTVIVRLILLQFSLSNETIFLILLHD